MGSLSLRMQSVGRIAGLLLGFCLATATLATPQKPTDEEVENAIQIVTTNSTTLGPGEGFRCGVFFAGEKNRGSPNRNHHGSTPKIRNGLRPTPVQAAGIGPRRMLRFVQ